MKFVAEITVRTVPFDAESPDDARAKGLLLANRLPTTSMYPTSRVIEVEVYEHTELDD